jgi:penicillin-binding protein 1A
MNPETAYHVQDMMRSVVEMGTAREAKKLGRPAAGKTGTTNESMDAWFIGFTPEMLTGVWVGFDAERTLGAYTGGRAAAPIWTAFMKKALEGLPQRDFPTPEGISIQQAEASGGADPAEGASPHGVAFAAGTAPARPPPQPAPTAAAIAP